MDKTTLQHVFESFCPAESTPTFQSGFSTFFPIIIHLSYSLLMALIEKGQVFSPEHGVDYAEGSVVSREILRNTAGTLTLFAFDQGQGLSEHTAPFDATVTILDGEAEILLNGVPHYPKAGEMLIMPAGVPHALNAKQRFKMLLTMIRG